MTERSERAEVSIPALQEAIRNTHGCDSVWIESAPVRETFNGETVWEGEVQVFDLPNCAAASRCYAWSHEVDGSGRRRFFTVLHIGPVNSPKTAVEAAIVSESRKERNGE